MEIQARNQKKKQKNPSNLLNYLLENVNLCSLSLT